MQSIKIDSIFAYFRELFGPEPKCELNFSSDIELLVAIILSAQCTDKRVNIVTERLFKKYKTIRDFANARFETLSREIYSTGFYRNKAQNIIFDSNCNDFYLSGSISYKSIYLIFFRLPINKGPEADPLYDAFD